MTWLIMFDITEKKRLTKVAKLLQEYGVRVQFSVFEVKCHPHQFKQLVKELTALLKEQDRIHCFHLCQKDLNSRKADGLGKILVFPNYVLLS